MTTITRSLRNADLQTLAATLQAQHHHKLDMVLPIEKLTFNGGSLLIGGMEQIISDSGVTDPNGTYEISETALTQISDKIGVPIKYLRRLATTPGCSPLLDLNLNFWTQNAPAKSGVEDFPIDNRRFLVRTFVGDSSAGGTGTAEVPGIFRALLSDSYGRMDHLDSLMAFLQGMKDTGIGGIEVRKCDLSDNRMSVTVSAPSITAAAPDLLSNYRSPFTGQSGKDLPIIEAGITLTNSETGGGAWVLKPELRVQVCSNGLVVTKDAMRSVHLGSKLEEGNIRWSQQTMEKENDLLSSKVRDAVSSWLSESYLHEVIEDLSTLGDKTLKDPSETITMISKELKYSQEETIGLLSHFIKGGDIRSAGILHAVTSYAQEIEDPDRAQDFNSTAIRALELASR